MDSFLLLKALIASNMKRFDDVSMHFELYM